jgi:hypothetical protein
MPLLTLSLNAGGFDSFYRSFIILFLVQPLFCNNVSAVYMASNPVQHRQTKHIEIDIHFVREKVSLGQVCVLHVPSSH